MNNINSILNTIIFDDCMNIMKKMPDKSINLTLTDIPYSECNKISAGLRNIDKGDANTINFDLIDFVKEIKRITKDSIYIFCGIEQVSPIFNEIKKDMSARLCVWEKTNPSPMNGQYLWLSATENCVFAKTQNATFNEKCKSNVWKFPCGSSKIHPTEKPINLFSYLIETSSKKGDIVFDPCSGSGTTAIACIAKKRHFICVEKNETWFNMSVNRIKTEISNDIDCLQSVKIV